MINRSPADRRLDRNRAAELVRDHRGDPYAPTTSVRACSRRGPAGRYHTWSGARAASWAGASVATLGLFRQRTACDVGPGRSARHGPMIPTHNSAPFTLTAGRGASAWGRVRSRRARRACRQGALMGRVHGRSARASVRRSRTSWDQPEASRPCDRDGHDVVFSSVRPSSAAGRRGVENARRSKVPRCGETPQPSVFTTRVSDDCELGHH